MAIDRIPPGLIPSSGSHTFTEDSIPDALQKEHKLAAGHWGVLHVFEGSLNFVDIGSGEQRTVSAPDLVTIHPRGTASGGSGRPRKLPGRLLQGAGCGLLNVDTRGVRRTGRSEQLRSV